MDPLMLLFLLIAGLTGADRVSKVSRVAGQSGGSVTIPCLYEDRYKNHVKYWCRGSKWRSCDPIVRTDSPQKKGDVSIRDDPEQQVFTVTMNNLTTEESNIYWCLVEISGHSDVGPWVTLSVTDGSPGLSVDKQEVIGVEGDSVSVQCRYGDRSREMKWCKIRGSCVSGNSESLDGRPVEIRDDRVNKVFNVTMWGLERKDTGWYWCDDRFQQIPVHVTVNVTTTAITEVHTVSLKTTSRTITEQTNEASAAGFTTKMLLQTVSAHDGEAGNNKIARPLVQLALYVVLGLLVPLLMIIFIIITWKVLDKHKKKMARNCNPGWAEFTSSLEPDAIYDSVDPPTPESSLDPDADVIYSSIDPPTPEQMYFCCNTSQ